MQNAYHLTLPPWLVNGQVSVLEFELAEQLDQPYRLTLSATCGAPDLPLASLINQPAAFSVSPIPESTAIPMPGSGARQWSGVIRRAQRGRSHAHETLYTFVVEPRLGVLADPTSTRLFQNQSAPQVIEAVLRHYGFTGADFVFMLTHDYPVRRHLTQFRESALSFIRRIAADCGLFCMWEQGEYTERMIWGDNLEHYRRDKLRAIPYREDAGLESGTREAVRSLSISHQSMLQTTVRKDFNFRDARNPLEVHAGFKGETPAAVGMDYEWGEHYATQEQGRALARLRQELSISRQCRATGEGNVLACGPGEVLRLDHSFADAPHGWLITAVTHAGSRKASYRNVFDAIPADRVWRPERLPWPPVSGTLPATVVSPDHNGYPYPFIDEDGCYRVRFDWDLDSWSPGGDSCPVRLARPCGGGRHGLHFPIHAGTRVNLAFTDGNIDRPYIASVMHDSGQPDLVHHTWNTRNVIRTRANNKLRMEDRKGAEHIKLATEHGKTQLNLGHLVDRDRQPRGAGFELRSDDWGALRAGKGLLLSADARRGATGPQRDMDEAVSRLDQANRHTLALNQVAGVAHAELVDLQAQTDLLRQQVKDLQQAVLLASAPAGMALTTGQNMHLAAGQTLSATAGHNMGLTVLKKLAVNVGETFSLLAARAGIKLLANQGRVQIQAQNDALDLAAQHALTISSSSGTVTIAAAREILLAVGGSYLSLKAETLELGSPGKVTVRSPLQISGAASRQVPLPQFAQSVCKACLEKGFAEANPLVVARA